MPDFSRRSEAPELMDTDCRSYEEFDQCLRQLAIINRLTFAYPPTLRWLKPRLAGWQGNEPPVILDIGSGGGDMLRRIAAMAERQGSTVRLIGVDLNPWAKRSAESAGAHPFIHYETANLFDLGSARRFDFIVSSLFTHHLDHVGLIAFLRWMEENAREGWFINDLHRHAVPYHFIKRAVNFPRVNRLVRHDAAVSVARAFTAADWRQALAEAGIPANRARLRWHFPFRYCLGRDKP